MSVLTATRLSQSFGPHDIFTGVTLRVEHGSRIGLVGPNGVGKTSLLRILADIEKPSSGTVSKASGARIGYLRQEAARAFADAEVTVWDEMLAAFESIRQDEARLSTLEEAMAEGTASEDDLARYGELQTRFERDGGYDYPIRARRVLVGLGLEEAMWEQPLAELSGGQKTRALLARLLLEAPDLLVLDEPTNHLDVAAVEWLEGFLSSWPGSLLVVSHDRYFLDRVATTIWELSADGIERYPGNYSAYVTQREARWSQRGERYRAVIARLDKEVDYIRRNIAGQNVRQAKGKLSRIAREVEAIHAGGLDIVDDIQARGWLQATAGLDMERPSDRIDTVAKRIGEIREPVGTLPALSMRLTPGPRGGDIVLRTRDLLVGYPGVPLVDVGELELLRGACAAFVGPNGSGKTTALRTLLGRIDPLRGEVTLGSRIEIGYFAQAHESLSQEARAMDEVRRHHPLSEHEARELLGSFLFTGDDHFKRVDDLSGGERGRLALAVLSLQGANFLVLDEPTNHLDILAQEMLQAVLEAFEGTILLVTHDRYLVDRLATEVWAIDAGRLDVYPFGYDEYREALASGSASQTTIRGGARPATAIVGKRDGSPDALAPTTQRMPSEAALFEAAPSTDRSATSAPALSKNQRRRLAERAAELEAEIVLLETRLEELSDDLQASSQAGDVAGIFAADVAMREASEKLRATYAEWEEASG